MVSRAPHTTISVVEASTLSRRLVREARSDEAKRGSSSYMGGGSAEGVRLVMAPIEVEVFKSHLHDAV